METFTHHASANILSMSSTLDIQPQIVLISESDAGLDVADARGVHDISRIGAEIAATLARL